MKRPVAWLDRFPSWAFLAMLGGLIGVAVVLSIAMPEVFWMPPDPPIGVNEERCDAPSQQGSGFFYIYFWVPILCDEGYNPYNTANLAVVLGLMLLWAYRLMGEMNEKVDTGLILAVVPYLVWGSAYRVLEDSDLFAPYGGRQPDLPAGTGFLDQYLGIFFITPIIYVEVTFVAVALLVWGHKARRVAEASGLQKGLQYYAYSLIALVALYTAMWAADPTWIRWVANPLVAVGAAAVAYWIMHRYAVDRGHFSPHVALGAYGMFFLVIGAYYVLRWMAGGVDVWHPLDASPATRAYPTPDLGAGVEWPVQWWIYLALVAAPAMVTYAVWRKGRIFGGAGATAASPGESYGRQLTVMALILLVEAVAVFLTIVGMQDLAQRQIAGDWSGEASRYGLTIPLLLAGPAAIAAGTWLARRLAARKGGSHPSLLHYVLPLNLLMVFGQITDALMTSLGIDVYSYTEKHELPGFLIEFVDGLGLPEPFGGYPTAIVMIPLKLLIVLLVIIAIDGSSDPELKTRANLIGLVKLGIIMVGLSPGVRNGLRLAMAT